MTSDASIRLLTQIAQATAQTRDLLLQLRQGSAASASLQNTLAGASFAASVLGATASTQLGRRAGQAAVRGLAGGGALAARMVPFAGNPGTAFLLAAGGLALELGATGSAPEALDERQRAGLARHDIRSLLLGIDNATASRDLLFTPEAEAAIKLLEERLAVLERGLQTDVEVTTRAFPEGITEEYLEQFVDLREFLFDEIDDIEALLAGFRKRRDFAEGAPELAGLGVPIVSSRTDFPPGGALGGAFDLGSELPEAMTAATRTLSAIAANGAPVLAGLAGLAGALEMAKACLEACACGGQMPGDGAGALPPLPLMKPPGPRAGVLTGVEASEVLVGGSGPVLLGLAQDNALWREHAGLIGQAGEAYARLGRLTGELPPELERLTTLGRSFGLTLSDALSDVVLRGEGVMETLQALERQVLNLATQKLITGPIDRLFDGLLSVLRGWLRAAQDRDELNVLALPA